MSLFTKFVNARDADRLLSSSLIFNLNTNTRQELADVFRDTIRGTDADQIVYPKIVDKGIEVFEGITKKAPYYPYNYLSLAHLYSIKWTLSNDQKYLQLANNLYQKSHDAFPFRQTISYDYALILIQQSKYDDSLSLVEKIYKSDPRIYRSDYYYGIILSQKEVNYEKALDLIEYALDNKVNPEPELIQSLYQHLAIYFYKKNDKDRYMKVANRLIDLDPKQKDLYQMVIDYINKNNKFPVLQFNLNQ